MFSLISRSISALSQQEFNHGHVSHIHSQQASHILWMNLQEHTINAAQQQEKCTHFETHFVSGSHWNISINYNTYLTIFSPHTIHPIYIWKHTSLFPQKHMAM